MITAEDCMSCLLPSANYRLTEDGVNYKLLISVYSYNKERRKWEAHVGSNDS